MIKKKVVRNIKKTLLIRTKSKSWIFALTNAKKGMDIIPKWNHIFSWKKAVSELEYNGLED